MVPALRLGCTFLMGLLLPPLPPLFPLLGLVLVALPWRGRDLALGLSLGALTASSHPPGPRLRGVVAVQGRVVAAPSGRRADLSVWACAEGGAPFYPCRGKVRVVFHDAVRPGTAWVVHGRGVPPPHDGLGGPQPATSMALIGARTLIWARRARPLDARPEPEPIEGYRAILAAVARGDRRGVTPDTLAVLRDTGTAHLLAISGFHVGVVAGLVGGLVDRLRRLLAPLHPAGFHAAWSWWAGATAAVLYTLSAGAPISAQRAAGIVLLGALGRSMGRTLDPWRLLVTVGIAVLMVDPAACTSAGFQLSFGAVAGILRFGPSLRQYFRALPKVGEPLAISIAATLGTLPPSAWWFQSLAPTSPLANLIAVPWMALGIAPLAAIWAYAPEPIAGIAGALGEISVATWIGTLRYLAMEPLHPAADRTRALLACAIFASPRRAWVIAVLLLCLTLHPRPVGGLEVVFFDVGQGDAALVQHPDGRRWLIDGGHSRRLVSALRRRGIYRIDRVYASHGDADHAGGLPAVLCDLDIDTLVVGRLAGHERSVEAALRCGVTLRLEPTAGEGSNDGSLAVRVESPWGDVLFTGDLTASEEQRLGPAAVLKVPHHGARDSSSDALLDRVRPGLAILSVGPNRYGHPHPETLLRYAIRGIPLLRTDQDGTIRLRLDHRGLRAGPERGRLRTYAPPPFSGERRATMKNTNTANIARQMLTPWL